MTDIVKRARDGMCEPHVSCPDCDMLREACDEIERLRAALDEHHVYTEWEARDGVLYVLCGACGHAKQVESHDQVREALDD